MTKNTKDWLLVYLISYPAIGVPTLGIGLLLPIAGLAGIVIGLSCTHPYYTISFKLLLVLASLLCFIKFLYRI